MLGMLFDDKECKELHYMLRKELDELLLDLSHRELDPYMKDVIDARYRIIFRMYARLATPKELSKYAIGKKITRHKSSD